LYRSNQKPVDSAHRVTPTLIALIVLFTILVTPSNIIAFLRTTSGAYSTFETATQLANFFLLSNFAVNFILYLVINAEFRRATRDLVTCRCSGQGDVNGGGHAMFDAASDHRSRRWRSEAGRRALDDYTSQQDDERGGGYRVNTAQRNPDIIVTGETDICNFSEAEIAV